MVIRKDKNGKYMVDVSNGFDPITNKQKRFQKKNISTKEEAIQIEMNARLFKLNDISKSDNLTIDNLFNLMLKENIKEDVKQSYVSSQQYNFKAHIQPYFEHSTIKKVQRDDIIKFRDYLQSNEKKLSNNTVNKIMILLKKIFDSAIKVDLITDNPCLHLKKLKVDKKKMQFWTITEYKDFINSIDDKDKHYKYLFTTLFFTGMRIGEALALTWNDINFATGEINVTKTTSIIRGETIISEPKTKASIRRITINRKLVDELFFWKEKQQHILESYLMTVDNNTQVYQFQPKATNKDMVHKKFKYYLKKNPHIKVIRIHDLRHSHVALLINLSNGREEYDTIKERLGHSSITTTIDTYSHLYPNKQKSVSDPLDDFF
ncbi:hypothetical protein IV75_GL000993 [Carnobacterium maltaromaticum]|uniref:tyrosine-type recombinase/integrase n=1 Tax=Carnobacterium maltaromaticum TaxID=2751 RepID=UPI00070523EA|nr:tyrosine-type recombinase/integrase [Carnobacterium maltaromaticum]KRN83828.1 hypothetical protein IV75_GL000993 [Carnobacterium maltaromaticum]